jgi:hypothetical protein
MLKYFLVATLLLLNIPKANAFPELIRHGYVNCTTCHVSPSGGGILTAYGRGLSKEVLSGAGVPHEEDPLQGLISQEKMPEWLLIGGDVRAVQIRRETPVNESGRFIWMQADFETAVRIGKVTLDGTFGRIEKSSGPAPGSRRYFATYQATDEAAVRVGRFYPAFGLNIPDHFITTRSNLGFDEGMEMQNVELSWLGENWNFYLTGSASPGEIPSNQRESAFSGQAAYAFKERYKVGASVWSGDADGFKRKILAAHAVLGFTKHFYLLTETDLQWRSTSTAETRQITNYQKLGYEFIQGIHAFAMYEYTHADMSDPGSITDGVGAGLRYFPRPHFEVEGTWEKQRMRSAGDGFDINFAWLLLHYYL